MSDEFRMTTAHRSLPRAYCLPLTFPLPSPLPSRLPFAPVAATAAAIAAAAVAAATTTTAIATTTAATILARSRFVHVQSASVDFLAVELRDRRFRFFLGSHFDKA